ncbi:hypothetical protein MSG28_001535 [Choristoneura fumiferana]|uniref:Uncharacterized protein n=1 Tax=Choristoneura fumiferana TaxID=7141 RepID=A0ACC0KVL6_CHOFU|nr:hypothetical protein MSG28_001535 [Choristoneura fumiferana]
MIRALLVLAVGLAAGVSQPLACQEDYQCGEGYCDKESLHCAQCLLCEDFSRNPPSTPISCITTVTVCGSCYEG